MGMDRLADTVLVSVLLAEGVEEGMTIDTLHTRPRTQTHMQTHTHMYQRHNGMPLQWP